MPDKRRHRGAHPEDAELFAANHHATLRTAVTEYSWLLTRGYADESALKLVGDRHDLTARQRLAVWRSACSDQQLQRRRQTHRAFESIANGSLAVDGYNVLITIESALAGGLILVGRDGCYRDLASVHGTYRKVDETLPAFELIADYLAAANVQRVDWYLDRPVSNSGRLKALMADALEAQGRFDKWNIELVDSPDQTLVDQSAPIASADSWILDRCTARVDLARHLVERIPQAWIVDLSGEHRPPAKLLTDVP